MAGDRDMTIDRHLEDLRAGLPGCSLVAYGDLSANLMLRTSADRAWAQEHLDALCKTASARFDLARSLRGTAEGGPRHAIVLTERDTRVFVGSDQDEADLLCCVCSGTADAEDILTKATATLQDISGT